MAIEIRGLRSTAPFWSVRYHEEKRETLAMRQDTLEPPRLSVDRGAMVAAVVDGGYGYCATSDLSTKGLQHALDRATKWAQATKGKSVVRYEPAKMAAPKGEYESPHRTKAPGRSAIHDLLANECKAAQREKIVERTAVIELVEEERVYLTNTGGELRQRFHFAIPKMRVVANNGANTQVRSYEHVQQGGFELVTGTGFVGSGARLADEALQLLAAPNCPSGKMDLILMPDQVMLQVHESVGHPLEFDRILGDERNFAGTSFVTPDMFGAYRYGSELLNITYDPTLREEVAAFGHDDDGTPASKVFLIKDGVLVAPLGGKLSQARAGMSGTANARACAWNRPPIDRMANINVEPGKSSFDSMLASVKRGVLMRTNVSWSIDDSRNKFQFGCEWGELYEDGKKKGVVKNPNYRGISATFWRSLRAVGDKSTFEVHGTQYCGKGEPNQVIHTGHAAPVCVFAGVDVFGGAEG